MLTDTPMYWEKMSWTYIRLASGFSISGSSYSLVEQQTIRIRATAVTMRCTDMIITTHAVGSLLVALGGLRANIRTCCDLEIARESDMLAKKQHQSRCLVARSNQVPLTVIRVTVSTFC